MPPNRKNADKSMKNRRDEEEEAMASASMAQDASDGVPPRTHPNDHPDDDIELGSKPTGAISYNDGDIKHSTVSMTSHLDPTNSAIDPPQVMGLGALANEIDLPAPLPLATPQQQQQPQEPGAYSSSLSSSLRRTEDFQKSMLREPSDRLPQMRLTQSGSSTEPTSTSSISQQGSLPVADGNDGLVVANQVSNRELQVAQKQEDKPTPRTRPRRRSKRQTFLLVASLSLTIGTFLMLLFVLAGDDKALAPQQSTAPSLAPTVAMESLV